MNPFYKQPVIVFGVIAPLLGLFVLLGVAFRYKSGLESDFRVRKAQFVEFKKIQKLRESLQEKVKEQEPYMASWMVLFNEATSSAVNTLVSDIQKRTEEEAFQKTSFRRSMKSSGIGSASKQPSVQLQFTFRGTYRGLQNAFLEVETSMPHLQLDSIKLKQDPNQNLLNAEVSYTAWQKE